MKSLFESIKNQLEKHIREMIIPEVDNKLIHIATPFETLDGDIISLTITPSRTDKACVKDQGITWFSVSGYITPERLLNKMKTRFPPDSVFLNGFELVWLVPVEDVYYAVFDIAREIEKTVADIVHHQHREKTHKNIEIALKKIITEVSRTATVHRNHPVKGTSGMSYKVSFYRPIDRLIVEPVNTKDRTWRVFTEFYDLKSDSMENFRRVAVVDVTQNGWHRQAGSLLTGVADRVFLFSRMDEWKKELTVNTWT